MKVYYTDHGEEQVAERNVSKADVRKTILAPDWTAPAESKGCIKHVKQLKESEITVIAKVRRNRAVVVSVWKKEVE